MVFFRFIGLCLIGLITQKPVLAQLSQIYQLRATGEKLYNQSKYDQAKWYYRRAYSLSIKQNQTDIAANLLVDISSVELLGGNYTESTLLCLKGLSVLTKSGNGQDSTFFKLLSSLGSHYQQLSRYDSSAYYFAKADDCLAKHPALIDQIPDYVMYHYSNQALLHEAIGRYSLSRNLAQKALDMARQRHLSTDISIFCNVLAGQYERLGNYSIAMQLRKEGLANNHVWDLQRARIYSGIGRNAYLQKNYQEALPYLNRSYQLYNRLAKHSSQADTRMLANLYNHLGQCHAALHHYDLAEIWLDRAITAYGTKYGLFGKILATSWLTKSKIKNAKGQSSTAMLYSKRALAAVLQSPYRLTSVGYPDAPDVLDEKVAVMVLLHEGNLFMQLRHWSKALAAYQCGIAVFQQAQKHLKLLDDRLYANETVIPLYQSGLEAAFHLYQQNRTKTAYNAAFELMEQSRSIALQEIVSEEALQPQYIPEVQRRQDRKLRQKLAAINAAWFSAPSSDRQQQLKAEEADINRKHYELLLQWQKNYPAYYQARYGYQSVSLQQIQSRLADDQAYINYSFQHNRLHIFAITRTGTVWKTVPVDSVQLFRTISALQGAVRQHPGLSQYHGTPYALQCFEWFIGPIGSYIDNKPNWIINTGNVFENLPFEVLETGQKINDYVSLAHSIRYVYTVTSLLATPRKKPLPLDSILAVAPFSKPMSIQLYNRFRYPTLTASQDEASTIRVHWLRNQQATRAAFLQKAPHFSIWYLDTHAYLNPEVPMQSFIAFYPTDTSCSHRLYAGEVSQMDLRNLQLLVLSACKSGSGRLYQSEGMLSLARTFAYAGCPSVISPLWNAHDRTSAFLLHRIHNYLEDGYSPAIALQRARGDFFTSAKTRPYNHPFFWANFRLIGLDNAPDKRVLLVTWLPSNRKVLAVLAVVFCLLALVVYHRVRSRI